MGWEHLADSAGVHTCHNPDVMIECMNNRLNELDASAADMAHHLTQPTPIHMKATYRYRLFGEGCER
jgi:hypothetical protein